MGGKLNVYGLGSLGVNVDKNPINLEDGELTKAQNAIHDPTGSMGGLRKRPGLTKINSSAVSGSVFGIANVPIDPTATRRFLIGVDQGITTAYQWLTSTDVFSSVSTATTPAAPSTGVNHAFAFFNATYILTHRGLQADDHLFLYPGAYTRGTPQPIRAFDGTVDRELFRIPLNPKAVATLGLATYAIKTGGVIDWCVANNKIYFVSLDLMFPGTVVYSTVFEYDMSTGAIQQIGEGAGSGDGDLGDGGVVFTCVTFHQGFLYAGVGSTNAAVNSTASGVYRIRPGVDSTWTYDFDNSGAADADHETPVSMASYKGLLYVGMWDLNSTSAHVRVRSETGVYTSSTSMGNGVGSAWPRMKVFGDNLYASAWDNNGSDSVSTIRKFDGSAWSVVKTIDTGPGNDTPRVGIEMIVNNSVLFVLAVASTRDAIVTFSSNGTSWTDQNSQMTNDNALSIFGVLTD